MGKRSRSRPSKSRITKRILTQYLLAVSGFFIGLAVFVLGAEWICGHFIWYADDALYQILTSFKRNLYWICGVIVMIGWSIITYFFVFKPLRYIDEIVGAAKRLASPDDEEIALSGALYEVQYELNLVREKTLRSAELAREAEKRKNDLIVYLAHDLKTPLTSVIGYLTLLRDEPEIPAQTRAKYTGIALDKAERLEQLINEFFDITRFSLSELSLELRRINLSMLLEQTVSEFYPILAEKSLEWKAEIEPNAELLCDPDKLERVFDNLVRNAVNYSYPNSAISLKMTSSESLVEIVLSNRGRTIPKEKLDKVFEQFFRLDPSRSANSGGAGLGLAIAKEIVTLHGGEITAESENESIVFTVKLPKI